MTQAPLLELGAVQEQIDREPQPDLNFALPMLIGLRDRKQGMVGSFTIPEGGELPAGKVLVLPYYMFSQDHAHYGV